MHRHGEPLQRVHAKILEVEHPAHQPPGALTDHDTIGGGQSFEPGSNIRRLTEGQLLVPPSAPHLPHDDWACVDPHPNGQSDPLLPFHARIQRLNRLENAQSCTYRPLRIIFMCLRKAEIDQQAIAKVLGDIPSKRWITPALVCW